MQNSKSISMIASMNPTLQVDQVTVEHLQQHFVNFAKNDNLGRISTWLLAQADALGPNSYECLDLAALHSTAVDFSKTGKPAELDFGLVRSVTFIEMTTAAYAMPLVCAMFDPVYVREAFCKLSSAGCLAG
jgi:hypothetical protein